MKTISVPGTDEVTAIGQGTRHLGMAFRGVLNHRSRADFGPFMR